MTAVLDPREQRLHAPPAARRVATPHTVAPTPLFTRHMPGAIEADRNRRRVFRETHLRPRRRENEMPHPRIAAAIAAHARLVSQSRVDLSRWIDEGGRFDPAVAVRRRNDHKETKRCSS
ncbi:MAG TPA: hypothetical protein VFG79_11730 [Solirubrobacter sp.]|jgi:hypothetical protein|nr:hypothetical protein [Solirubrobacter sp.]